MEGKDMDIRERYAKFVQDEIRENSNPYPTGIQGFVAGVESETKRIIAMAEAKVCFGHQETGNCEHSVCFGMRDLIRKIEDSQ